MTPRQTRTIVGSAAILLFVTGVSLLFLPDELAAMMNQPASPLIQIGGAGAIALGIINWMGRSSPIGGIYRRPQVVGNLAFAFVTAGTLVRLAIAPEANALVIAAAVVYILDAAAFGLLLFSSPTES